MALISSCFPARAFAQQQRPQQRPSQTGTLRGRITYATTGEPIHNVGVQIVQLRLTTVTGDDGSYEFTNVPAGNYTVVTHLEGIPDAARTVTVAAGEAVVSDFALQLTDLREQVTVTASGIEESTAESFRSVNSVTSITLAEESHPSLGEVLEKEPGVAKRSFGPGSARPVIRGFDGDRVLVLKDGVRTGSLGSQSGDHGEPIDVLQLERLEVVKGPATLLYGSNALGGVVNAVTRDEQSPHEGLRGFFTGLGGTTNNQAGVSAGVEYWHKGWAFWGGGTGQRTGDYDTPLGPVPNSKTRMTTAEIGVGHFGTKGFFSVSYNHDQRRYGVPFAAEFEPGEEEEGDAAAAAFTGGLFDVPRAEEEEAGQIDLDMRRRNVRVSGGLRDLDAFVSGVRASLDFTDYRHQELEGETVGTTFDNDVFSYRAQFDQRRYKVLNGRFGFEGFARTYETVGAEALVLGPIEQKMFSVFGLEELDFERFKFQFGGRVETNRLRPSDPQLPARDFTGFSGAAGVLFRVYPGGSVIANYTHSYRAPALEELYNFGPHIGNLTFEIGNPDLTRERADGVDFSFRHSTPRARVDANVFYYRLRDFVFLAPVDEDGDGVVDIEDGLTVARYLQGDSRYTGADVGASFDLGEHVGVTLGFDVVSARLKDGDVPLPRIPPMRGRVGLDLRRGGLSVRPEAVFVRDQDALFPTETRTAGYAVFDLLASYAIARPHFAHIFSVNAFNLGDRLYRNHLSFIKERAPEIGRGVRFTYTVRFF
ncbi:MAG TPA: TonB-dependent receptor [Pyrinomonadaceae bacterium]|nr:TonB-dependent receptor [Pyrinomonadaceae bacterium]